MHPYLLHNGVVRDAGERVVSPGQVGMLNGWGVFSTLRVADGVLFAYERHFARMKHDAARMRVPFVDDPEALRDSLLQLVRANEAWNSTLRVAVVRNRGGMWEGPGLSRPHDVVAFTASLNDWGTGVRLRLVPQGRHAATEFAGAKITSWAQNLCWYEAAHDDGFDEVILLNERGELSECTSANLFLVSGGEVATPPLSSGCLPGVTRALLLEEIRVPGIKIAERDLRPADLEAADGAFLTSTTRELLPIHHVEGLSLRQGDRVRQRLQSAFTAYLRDYVSSAQHRAAPTPMTA